MGYEDYDRHYGYKAPPPIRGFGIKHRLALHLKTVVGLGGFCVGLLSVMLLEPALLYFISVYGILCTLAMFFDRFPKLTRLAAFTLAFAGFLVCVFYACSMLVSGGYSSLDFLGLFSITVYYLVVAELAHYQLRRDDI